MSKSYICDRCGKIQQVPAGTLWTVDSFIANGDDRFRIDLCSDCYKLFYDEFLKNLREEGGMA